MLEELNGDFLQWLRGFYHVARTGSVRQAAALMHRNPSTISYQIRCLEDALNVVLFDRYKKSMRITAEGKKLLGWTISTFETLQSMRSAVGNVGETLQGTITLATTLPIITMAVPAIVEFIRRHQGIDLEIRRALSHEVRQMVGNSEVDFGLLPIIKKPSTDNMEVIFKARPVLVVHKDNPWHIPDIPDIEDLRRLPYVTFYSANTPDKLDNFSQHAGFEDFIGNNSVIQVNNYHLILRFVWFKLGATIMDEICFLATTFGAEWSDLQTISLDHLLPHSMYGILTRKHKHISPQAQTLINSLRQHFRSISTPDMAAIWSRMRQQPQADI